MIRDNFIVALKSDLSKLSAELVEVGIDQILEHDLWKDIPVVSSMVSIFRVGMNIKERIFFKKLLIFLNAIKEIPLEDRVDFLSKFKEEKVKELGEKIIFLIDQLDDLQKSIIIANIDNRMFFRLSSAVQKGFIDDLTFLRDNFDKEISGYEAIGLYNLGLVGITGFNEVEPDKTEYKANYLGELLAKYGFE